MRDRLINLMKERISSDGYSFKLTDRCSDMAIETLADYLLAEGVIVPPMKLGQTCFEICTYRNEVEECRVSSITQKADSSFKIRVTNLPHKSVFEITSDKIGKTIFLTKSEAERALARRERDKK